MTSQTPQLTRRAFVASAARLGLAASTLGTLDALALVPDRAESAARRRPSDIQFDVADVFAPARRIDGVVVRFPPVYTSFTTLALRHRPTRADQQRMQAALREVERLHPLSPRGALVTLAYGVPYFERLPGGIGGTLVRAHVPRLRSDPRRLALEEAVAGPTDVSPSNPGVVKRRFGVPVRIEDNDVLLIVRSDSTRVVDAVLRRLTANPALEVTSRRLMFQQTGLPRKVAERERLPFAGAISPRSPMWMGFSDQQVTGSGPAAAATFAGTPSARLTTAKRGDYFDNGAVVHLSHLIEDLEQFYAEPYRERVQCMFRPNPPPARGNADQFADGGGPAFLDNTFRDGEDARAGAAAHQRIGHLAALQRRARAGDSTPLHVRADGAGVNALDVPDATRQPKLHFAMFIPTAQPFVDMRHAPGVAGPRGGVRGRRAPQRHRTVRHRDAAPEVPRAATAPSGVSARGAVETGPRRCDVQAASAGA